jgi:hypothetical protein
MNYKGNNSPFFVMVIPGSAPVSVDSISATGTSDGGGGNGVENRLTKLEKDVEYIQKDITAIKGDVSKINTFIEKVKSKAILWLVGTVITLIIGQGILDFALRHLFS